MPRTTRIVLVIVALVSIAALGAANGRLTADPSAAAPTPVTARCDQQHPQLCHRAITYWRAKAKTAQAAAQWQRGTRLREIKRVNDQLVAPYAQAVAAARLAYAVCVAYLGRAHDCPPPRETLLIGRCESGLQTVDPNPASTADGPHQYLESTWAGAGFVAFARTEYLPSFLAIELYGANHHRTYSPWRASIHCHHLS